MKSMNIAAENYSTPRRPITGAPLMASVEDLIEAMPIGVLILDTAGKISLVNSALLEMFGYARSELIGATPSSLISGIALSFPSDLGGANVTQEGDGRKKNGRTFAVDVHFHQAAFDGHNGTIISVRDTSERRRQRNNFRRVIESASHGMLMVDVNDKIVFANTALGRIFGYAPDALQGLSMDVLVPERYRAGRAGFREILNASCSPEEAGRARDLIGLCADGKEVPVEVGLAQVDTASGSRFIATVVDIAKRKALELDLRHANANLEEFTYVASHDLKSPLRGLADLLSWIEEGIAGGDSAKVHHNLDRARVRIERMENVITDLLSYARSGRRETNYEEVDIANLLHSIVDMQSRPPGFKISVQCNVGKMTAVKTPLETVLRNLLSNAIHHHHRADGNIEIDVAEDEAYCIFRISDDGPGIPQKAHERVFKLFQTMTTSERSGGGLGLALAKRLVEGHGGRIALESGGDAPGSTFRVWWPRFPRKAGDDE